MNSKNCWEVMRCGRERGGTNSVAMGVCPAYTQDAGQACWLIAGTFCGGKVQGSAAKKHLTCMNCSYYKSFDVGHHVDMRRRFGTLA